VTDWFADLSLNYTEFALAFVLVVGGREAMRRLARARRPYRILFGTLYAIGLASVIAGWVLQVIWGNLHLPALLLSIAAAVVCATALEALRQRYEDDSDDADTHETDPH
jgi:hypothetical protein